MKVILITGGSEGLGYELAKKLSRENYVVILSPDEGMLKKAAVELDCTYAVADVSKWDQVEDTVLRVTKRFKKIDVLINNAGIYINGQLDANDPFAIKQVIDVNLLGMIYMSKAVIPGMKKQKHGIIINISSQSGLHAKKDRSVYRASKWGVAGFTKCLQMDLSKYGIKVTGIYPGLMRTNLFKNAKLSRSLNNALDPSVVADVIESTLRLDKSVEILDLGIKHLNE